MMCRICVFGLIAVMMPAWAAEVAGSGSYYAEVNGVKPSREEFDKKSVSRLFQARNAYYESERKVADELINEYLVESQAQKEKLTVPQLLEKHVNSKLPPDPSDDALRVYFEGLDTQETFEAVRDKILDHLRQRRIAKLKTAYVQSLRQQATIAFNLSQPRADVPVNNTPLRGSAGAPVTIVEYADYECPYCQQIQPAMEKLQSDYKGKIAFAYKDIPLPNHPNAQKAAEAKHCAGDHGKYWDFHDLLVASNEYSMTALKNHARTLNLDAAAFDKCMESGTHVKLIKNHVDEAQNLGLQGTPSFFINGRFFSGVLSYEKLREVVEEELAAAGKGPKAQKTAQR